MGASAKTLRRLIELSEAGLLPFGAQICDIGTSQLGGPDAFDMAKQFLAYYEARRAAPATSNQQPATSISDKRLREISNGGLLGELLTHAGFEYAAVDVFKAERTIVFDLNRHSPGPKLLGKFDLITNFGTTEHVFNQVEAFRTIHDLAKPQGVMYHDLPLNGYLYHGLFRYDPLFFHTLMKANNYKLIRQLISTGGALPAPPSLIDQGLENESIKNVGIEVIFSKPTDNPFRIPLEISTSMEPFSAATVDNENVTLAIGQIEYAVNKYDASMIFLKISNRLRLLWRQALKKQWK